MLFIAGYHDTGKTTLAEFLTKNGFLHIETSKIVRYIYQDSGSNLSFGDWAKQNGHGFDSYIIDKVKIAKELAIRDNNQDIVVTGNRQVEGIKNICQNVEPLVQRKHLVVYLEASPEILFERHQHRPDRKIEGLTIDKFKSEMLGYDKEMGVEKIKEIADVILRNDADIQSLYSCFSNNFRKYGYQLNPPLEGQDFCPMRRK